MENAGKPKAAKYFSEIYADIKKAFNSKTAAAPTNIETAPADTAVGAETAAAPAKSDSYAELRNNVDKAVQEIRELAEKASKEAEGFVDTDYDMMIILLERSHTFCEAVEILQRYVCE